MNSELRELLGKVVFEQHFSREYISWESIDEQTREQYRQIAETVALELVTIILPTLQHLTFYFTGKQIDLNLT